MRSLLQLVNETALGNLNEFRIGFASDTVLIQLSNEEGRLVEDLGLSEAFDCEALLIILLDDLDGSVNQEE